MPSPKREATENAILDATSALIAEKGVDGFTISEAAKRGGINRALIYHYFQNRDNLVFQAIRHIVHRVEEVHTPAGPDAAEQVVRMHLEHPEIGRFLFQLLLTGRQVPALSRRIYAAIDVLAEAKAETAPDSAFDPEMTVISGWLMQLSWSFAREEIARHLGISVEEADERFIAHVRRMSRAAMRAVGRDIE